MKQSVLDSDLLAELFAQAPGLVASCRGPDHVLFYVNLAMTRLIGNREVVGKPLREAIPEVVSEGLIDILDHIRVSGRPYAAHHRRMALRQSEGPELTDVFVDFVYQPIRGPDGEIAEIIMQGHDVTQQMEAEGRAEELQARLLHHSKQSGMDSMGAMLAHELNQPLTVIVNTLRAARNFMNAPTPVNIAMATEALGDIEQAALRAGELIRRLRDTVSRGHIRNRPENLAEIVRSAIDLTSAARVQNGITCGIDIAPDIIVQADRIQLQQVFVNLINNAVEALAKVPVRSIEIIGATSGGFARVDVADTGSGLGPETAEHIFEPMFTTKSQGLGLGLSICRAIIEAHDGTIALINSCDRGTKLQVSIPCTTSPSL